MTNALQFSAVAIAASLVTAVATAQTEARHDPNTSQRSDSHAKTGEAEFDRGSSLIGKDVANANNEVIASVQNFILDRGSGRLEHVLLKSGAVLGIGGKTIAVPYTRLRFDDSKKRFELDMTAEQIDRASAFVPENWSELQNTTWADQLDQWWYGEDRSSDDDKTAQAVKSGTPETIKGTIRAVDRIRTTHGEQVVVTVQSTEGRLETLVFGPSWYVMGDAAAPMRGDAIEAETVRVPDEDQGRRLVLTAKLDGDTMVLRDPQGHARWRIAPEEDAKSGATPGKRAEGRESGRLMLLSALIGAPALTTDDTRGEVQDVVIHRLAGQIAIIGFDPNENLLGIADEIKSVPWGVVRVAPDQKVHIDATSAMLKACEKLPDDVTVYSSPARLETVYTAFALKPVQFIARNRDESRSPLGDAWGKDGYYTVTFRDAPEATIIGRVTTVRVTSLRAGAPEARVVTVATEDGERLVILGPEWYLKRQSLSVEAGDQVTIQGRRARITDREYICAQTINADGRALTLWESDRPVWADAGGR